MTDTDRLIADARRALTALEDLIDYCDDPGSEALGARHCLAATLNALGPGERAPDVPGVSPEADTARILRIVRDHVVEANDVGGVDANDLVTDLKHAGYELPADEDE